MLILLALIGSIDSSLLGGQARAGVAEVPRRVHGRRVGFRV